MSRNCVDYFLLRLFLLDYFHVSKTYKSMNDHDPISFHECLAHKLDRGSIFGLAQMAQAKGNQL